MKPAFLTVVIAILFSKLTITKGLVDCQTACGKCKEGTEDIDILEISCSMCKECRDKRRILMGRQVTRPVDPYPEDLPEPVQVQRPARRWMAPKHRFQKVYRRPPGLRTEVENEDRLATWPEHCPTPPLCDEEPVTEPPTTSTLPPPTCPPIDTCRKRPVTQCVPCEAECPCPFPSEINININWNGKNALEDSTKEGTEKTSTDSVTKNNAAETKVTVQVPSQSKESIPGEETNASDLPGILRMLLMGYNHHNKGKKHNARGNSIFDSDIERMIQRTNVKRNSNDDYYNVRNHYENIIRNDPEDYFTRHANADPYMRNLYKNDIRNFPDDYYTRQAHINYNMGPNLQNTHQDQDYVYLYVGVPKNPAEGQSATTPYVPVIGIPQLQMF